MPIHRQIVVLYTIRNEDEDEGRRDRFVRDEIRDALRWHPPCFDKVEGKKGDENVPGIRALHDLDEGNAIPVERMAIAIEMLWEAIRYYKTEPIEPYAGRNAEALVDIELLAVRLAEGL